MGPLNLDVKFVRQNLNHWDADSEIGRTTPIDDLNVDGKWAVPRAVSQQSNHSGITVCFLSAELYHYNGRTHLKMDKKITLKVLLTIVADHIFYLYLFVSENKALHFLLIV